MHISLSAITVCSVLIFKVIFVVGAPVIPRKNVGDDASRFVIYTDKRVQSATGLPEPSDLKGYTHLLLGFLLPSGPADQSQVWSSLDATARQNLKAQYAAAGIKVMVSAFGGTSAPTSEGQDPGKTATTMAQFVQANDLDGIDIDYEDLQAVSAGTAVAWVETFMTTLRQTLPSGQFLVSHAPLAPHFSPSFPASPAGAQGPYLQIDKSVGSLIDFYNVQFYNDGDTVYTDCDGLLTTSSSAFPKSSLFEIAASGVSLNKLLIGKPIATADASNGFMSPELIGTCVKQAVSQRWNGGVMGFEFTDRAGAAAFIAPSLPSLGGSAPATSFIDKSAKTKGKKTSSSPTVDTTVAATRTKSVTKPKTKAVQDKTSPVQSKTDPNQSKSKTSPSQSKTSPNQGKTNPNQSKTNPNQSTTVQSKTKTVQSEKEAAQNKTKTATSVPTRTKAEGKTAETALAVSPAGDDASELLRRVV